MRLRSALLVIIVVALLSGTAFPDGFYHSVGAYSHSLPEVLVGRWRSETVHLYADESNLRERGIIKCSWILERTYLQCERRYSAESGASRHSIQFYARDAAGTLVEVMTVYAGRTTRALQSVQVISGSSISLTGTIRLRDGRDVRTRGVMVVVSENSISYRNETEESPGRWRVDYEERYTRR